MESEDRGMSLQNGALFRRRAQQFRADRRLAERTRLLQDLRTRNSTTLGRLLAD